MFFITLGSPKLAALVAVNVIDVNDNAPYFVVPPTYSKLTNARYLAVASKDTPAFTPIVKITAKDNDSEANGKVSFRYCLASPPECIATNDARFADQVQHTEGNGPRQLLHDGRRHRIRQQQENFRFRSRAESTVQNRNFGTRHSGNAWKIIIEGNSAYCRNFVTCFFY